MTVEAPQFGREWQRQLHGYTRRAEQGVHELADKASKLVDQADHETESQHFENWGRVCGADQRVVSERQDYILRRHRGWYREGLAGAHQLVGSLEFRQAR